MSLHAPENLPAFEPRSLQFDPQVERVRAELLKIDPDGARTASVIRTSIDMLYNGRYTGRFRWDQLFKTEKTHAGTLLEINLQREFEFEDGDSMDFKIAGIDIDCKYSQKSGSWMIPPEAVGHLCLLVWFNDQSSRWELGVVRIDERILSYGKNRDLKRTIRSDAREAISWIRRDAPLPENVLLKLSDDDIDAIFVKLAGKRRGQKRVNELFRRAQGRLVSRTAIETAGMQDDPLRRVRYNGGARTDLQGEGIVIFGEYKLHQAMARDLGLPVPGKGEFVSARLTPYREHVGLGRVSLDGSDWMLASAEDPVVTAPTIPKG
ncbi:NaeI family type II restriction endonuclease [Glycomyces sp. MUSA5-2]|uniref:NaeI family type II restriction endonuclease n=1 Tax=Glycomyces sp. MUSA5-2 TaxID=2053002 RepID=UPI00300A5F28